MTPQDFEDRVNVWRVKLAMLGLSHWRFEFDYEDTELEDHRGREADAAVRVHENYDTAFWHVKPSTLEGSTSEVDEVIVHELMHVALRDLNAVEFDMMVEIGGQTGRVFGQRLEAANEQLVERLARAIVGSSRIVVP